MLTGCLALSLYSLISFAPQIGFPLALTYVCGMGAIRRYIIPYLGYASYDPFLLVLPLVVVLLFFPRLARREIPYDTIISKLIFVLLIIMFLEVFNPLQGGLMIGITGGMFYIVPLLWYYAARFMGSRKILGSILNLVVFIAVAAAAYGLYQQFFGFTAVEQRWLEITRNDVGQYLSDQTIRVFSTFSAFAEYVHFLWIAAIVCFALMLRKNRLMAIPMVFLIVAIFLSSSRGGVLQMLAGFVLMWAVQGKTRQSWAPRLVIAAVAGVVALTTGLQGLRTDNLDTTAQELLEHQKQGLLSPLDKKSSTGSGHLALVWNGIVTGFRNPLGHGLGSTTLAAHKIGTSWTRSAENLGTEGDVSDLFVSLGFVGGGCFLFLFGYSVWYASDVWHRYRDPVYLAALGILASSFGAWLIGARYATTFLVWIVLGMLDRVAVMEHQQKAEQARQATTEKQGRNSTSRNRFPPARK
ncbi:MAG: hypothetical protein OHK0029_38220 [Armatimonadaceae bacterium]